MTTALCTDPSPVDALRPDGPHFAPLLRAVTDRSVADEVAGELAAICAALYAEPVRIVFAGHFSCGKSTLINALIGRPLLPTGDLPETGVPCLVRRGAVDRVEMIAADDATAELPFGADAVSSRVRLIGDDGNERAEVSATAEMVIELSDGHPPEGVWWIDSPGIDDTAAMTERTRAATADADILVWVVNSRQPFAETEQEFVGEYIAGHGPAGVLFVVNAFLAEDTPDRWAAFLADRAPYMRDRIAEPGLTCPLPPRVVVVSARGMTTAGAGFGGPQLRLGLAAALAGVTPARLHRAAHRLRRLADRVGACAGRERERTRRLIEAHADRIRTLEQRREDYRRTVFTAASALYAARLADIDHEISNVRRWAAHHPLRYDNSYGWAITAALTALTAQLADAIVAAAAECARARELPPVTADTARALHDLLRPGPQTIVVPYSASGITAWSTGNPAADRAVAVANIDAAHARIRNALWDRRPYALDLVLHPVLPIPPAPGDEQPRALANLRRALDDLAATLAAAAEIAVAEVVS
ncbi:dynamin family protein [Nocardia sp. alder85J]|uniref:dynamin family protein n=1 Tax=Nocardia sp. alder85J TaxID=2862949 RepID=UPI001CD1EB7F|nr:dynamin family protein [Nocardia sp. alder85J]MCX4092345.1 dynamin family protein [Nocardia sp. alder85J]